MGRVWLRTFLGVLGGYVTMVACVIAATGAAWVAVRGGHGAFDDAGPEPSALWMTLMVTGSMVAATLGGWVANRIGQRPSVMALLVLILTMGLIFALQDMRENPAAAPLDKPITELSFAEAGQYAQQPRWYTWTVPLIGVVGVLVGARRGRKTASRS